MSDPNFLTPQQLCDRIPGLTVAALAKQRSRGGGPPFRKANARVVLYEWREYLDWLDTTKATRTDRYGES
ncbi:hypothetical protein [Pseudoclavibacter sp. VKM Ac-2888]|uniref:hypothetical protein n=1 Tax=Pseudoclavibacter sp. VKM Ac-2888 TaxID=2783830 RepID=UPI00188A1B8D|nr:hypothetical protein [Pseudoclavibacter sp. VKM Ac-2888]MBF4549252.1 hypothetical protein [Pseudoclavibacter sp. VKM Ac-2888]